MISEETKKKIQQNAAISIVKIFEKHGALVGTLPKSTQDLIRDLLTNSYISGCTDTMIIVNDELETKKVVNN